MRSLLPSSAALLAALCMSLAAPAAQAQSQPSTMQCPYTYLCIDTAYGSPTFGSLTFGGTVGPSSGYNTVLGFGAFGGGSGQTVVGSTAYMDATSHGFTGGEDARMTNVNQGVLIGDLASMKDVNGVTIGVQAAAGPTQSPLAYRRYMDDSNVAVGNYTLTAGLRNTTVGEEAQSGWQATDTDNTTIGARSYTEGDHNSTLGAGAQVVPLPFASSPQNSVAIGAGTIVNESNVVGVGYRRIIQLAPGIGNDDAVSITQLGTAIGYLGGGAGINNFGPVGTWTPPTYVLNSGVYHDVGSALTGLQTQIVQADGTTDVLAVHYDDATHDGITLQGDSGSTQIHNVAAGTDPGDAVNVRQLQTTAYNLGSALGGGSSYIAGVWTAPTYSLSAGTFNNVGDALTFMDANVTSQFMATANWLGGGSMFSGTQFTGPTYLLYAPGAAGQYSDVGSALSALDRGLSDVNTRVDNLPPPGTGGTGPAGPQGPQGDPGQNGTDGKDATGTGTDALAVHYDSSDKSGVTLQGADGTQVHNVAAGTANSDAANVGQVSAQVKQAISTAFAYTDATATTTLNSAKSYADAGDQQTLNWAKQYTDMKVRDLREQMSRTAAVGAANAGWSGNLRDGMQGFGAGAGWSGGHSAIAVGYRHQTMESPVSWSVAGAVSGSVRTVSVGIGYSW